MHIRLAAPAAVVLAASLSGSALAVHDADVNDNEFKCQFKTEMIAWRNFAKRISCVVSCQRDARAASQPPTDCVPPFAGSTQGCVNGSDGKAQGHICKACNPDTPECYPATQTCPGLADAQLAEPRSDADDLMADIYCDDSGSGDGLTPLEARCQDAAAKVLAKFGAKKASCLAKCHRYEHRGLTPAGSCPNDALGKTPACISKVEQASSLKIDRVCSPVNGGEAPECHGATTGAQWVQGVEDDVDAQDPVYICGSPSGAFLE